MKPKLEFVEKTGFRLKKPIYFSMFWSAQKNVFLHSSTTSGFNCQKKVWYVNFICHFCFWCHLKGNTPAYPHKKNNRN